LLLALMLPAGIVFALDQMSKRFVGNRLPPGQSISVGRYVHIRHVASTGLAGLVHSRRALVWLWLALLGVLLLLLRDGRFFQHASARIALGMALGGTASNLYDQLRRGKVIDFLDVAGWPVFNVADAAITMGALSALWLMH
jgi:signal peptidase II